MAPPTDISLMLIPLLPLRNSLKKTICMAFVDKFVEKEEISTVAQYRHNGHVVSHLFVHPSTGCKMLVDV